MRVLTVALALLVARTVEARDCVAADASVDSSRIGTDGVVVCYDRCWRLDYTTQTWTVVDKPTPRTVVPPPAPRVALATKVHVCSPDCHDVTLPGVAAITERDVVENADRSLIAVRGPSTDHDNPIHVFDAAAGTLLSTIKAWKTAMGDPATFQRVAFVGSAIFVAISDTPVSTEGRLYDPRSGRQLGRIGGKGASLDESVAIDLGGNVWGFASFDADEIYVVDVATGKALPTIRSGPKQGGYAALQLVGRTLVGVRSDAKGGVMLYDLTRRKATHHVVPACT